MDKAQKSWDGFTDSMPAHRRARAHAALSKQVRHKGEFPNAKRPAGTHWRGVLLWSGYADLY